MPDMIVHLTLERGVAERLRAMCHAKGVTASTLIAVWISQHDDQGRSLQSKAPERTGADFLSDLMDSLESRKRKNAAEVLGKAIENLREDRHG